MIEGNKRLASIENMRSKCAPKKNNPFNAPTIGADANRMSDTSLKDNEKTSHGETMLPHLDPQHRKEELTVALAVIKKVMSMEVAEPFNVPVNPIMLGITDYFDVIDKPMDFGTIRRNLENGVKYMNADDVFSDVQYIWENCYKYNKPGDPFLELVKQVKETFIMFWNAVGLYSTEPKNGSCWRRPKALCFAVYVPFALLSFTYLLVLPRFSEGPMARSPQDHSSHSQPQPHLSHKRLKSAQPSSSQPHPTPAKFQGNSTEIKLTGVKHGSPSRQKQTKGQGSSSSRKRTRGPTCYIGLLRLRPGERITPQWSEDGELVQQEKGKKLTSYLGTLVRCQRNAPLQVKDWSKYLMKLKRSSGEKFDIDDEHKDYVMSSMGSKYRSYRYKMKAKYYDPYSTDEERLSNCPQMCLRMIGGGSFIIGEHQRYRLYQRETRQIDQNMLSDILQTQMRKDGKAPNQIEMFVLTHTRKDGTPVDTESRDIMTQFEELSAQQAGRSPPPVDALYAQGISGALVKEFAYVKEQLASVNQQLEKQRKELEEMALQKQQMQEEMQEWMEEQLMKMKDEMTQQLQQHMQQFQQREVRQAKTAFTRITPKEALGGTNASDIFEVEVDENPAEAKRMNKMRKFEKKPKKTTMSMVDLVH
ncbi:Bromodomain-containing protein 4 [Vitis vinifera]|uniref:Bromodomain-containing protein 4 n=1 Tax=Vitis vinifera TaxID=29760 RepID=A0A438CY63_VITVI|nr:Bromodomain-containing protein 4 [Vitis vinifera]